MLINKLKIAISINIIYSFIGFAAGQNLFSGMYFLIYFDTTILSFTILIKLFSSTKDFFNFK